MSWEDNVEFSTLIGKTLTSIIGAVGSDQIVIETDQGEKFIMYHSQDCCESVEVEDICGDLADLIGSPIVLAEESSSENNPPGVTKDFQDSFTWTFYRLQTAKGLVVIRWYGESSGYYSEPVKFERFERSAI